uniref:Uncharacterized protein n=1 Tax=Romanomermis culicivorax TaxID=13658 RepID=A0A915JHI4_ROMCU
MKRKQKKIEKGIEKVDKFKFQYTFVDVTIQLRNFGRNSIYPIKKRLSFMFNFHRFAAQFAENVLGVFTQRTHLPHQIGQRAVRNAFQFVLTYGRRQPV